MNRARKYLDKIDPAVDGQNGHGTTFRAVREIVHGFDLTDDQAWPLILEYNLRCLPPWSERDLMHKVRDASEKEFSQPRGWRLNQNRNGTDHAGQSQANGTTHPPTTPPHAGPPVASVPDYKPFPVDVLPTILKRFVIEVAESVDCDPAFAALPAITIAGAAAGAAVVVSPKRGFEEPPLLYSAMLADSGTGKSPAARPAYNVAFAINRRLKENFNQELATYICDLEKYNAEDEPDPDNKPRKPVRQYFSFIDSTIERIGEMSGSSPRGMILIRDELDAWLTSFCRYRGKSGGSDVPNWLSMFDAGPICYHRRTGEPRDVEVDRAFVAVTGGIQPGILARVLSDPAFTDSGLGARVVFGMPPKYCPRWSDREVSAATERAFADMLDAFREMLYDPKDGPAVVKLTSDALARFKALNNEFAEQSENRDGGPMAAAIPKAVRIALRLALIVHLCVQHEAGHYLTGGAITDAEMAAGETLARWFTHEAERVYATLAERPEDRETRRLVELVRRKGGKASARDLQRSNPAKYKTSAMAELALDSLVTARAGDWAEVPPGKTGGQPTRVLVLRAATPPDAQEDGSESTRHNLKPTRHNPEGTRQNLAEPSENEPFSGGSEVVSGSVNCRVESNTEKPKAAKRRIGNNDKRGAK